MIEIKYLTSESPFRGACWAVVRNGKVCAYCFSEDVAHSLRVILNMQEK